MTETNGNGDSPNGEPLRTGPNDPVPTQKGKLKRRYDWDTVRAAYVEGVKDEDGQHRWPSLNEVADLFEVPANRCREHASKEQWTEQRAAYQSHLEKVRQERRAQELAQEASELDSRALNSAKAGLGLVTSRLGEIAQSLKEHQKEQQRRVESGQPRDFQPGLDAKELETLARAAVAWHQLGGRAIGDVETMRHEVVGQGGGPVEVESSIKAELSRDNPERLHGFLVALERSGLAGSISTEQQGVIESGEVEEGEIIEEGDDEE